MMPYAKILVTGGTGLVGKAVQEVCKSDANYQWVFVGSADANLTCPQQTDVLFKHHQPDLVLHLAARVGGLFNNIKNNLSFYRDNMIMQDNINQCCVKYNVRKLVSCLSTCIFPDQVEYPITEADLHQGAPHASNRGYAYAKRMVHVQNELYNQTSNSCLFTAVIPTNAYGPYDNFNLQEGHVIPNLIHKCYLAKQHGTDFVVSGTGQPVRQFIHSQDLARLLVWATLHYDDPEPVILADSQEVSILSVAESIAQAFDFTGKIVTDPSQPDGQFKKTVSNQKLLTCLPDCAFSTLNEGIHDTVQWFQDNYLNARK